MPHDTEPLQQVTAPEFFLQATEQGDVLRFTGAILARQETNRNNDEITEAGIDELAATIGGRPIDVEHRTSDNCGVFTAGRTVNVDSRKALSVDGLVWADRYPDTAAGMQAGAHHLSIEAVADKALCSTCGQSFLTAKEYCEHLTHRRQNGTRRTLHGLRAKGGAVTRTPAGTNTKFNPRSIYFVASHEEANELEAAHWYDKYLKEGETIDDLPSSDFADPEGRRFPYKIHGDVKTEGFRAAWSAAHGGHTGEADESAIAKLKRDKPEGIDISESIAQERASMEEQIEAQENMDEREDCPGCGEKVVPDQMVGHMKQHEDERATLGAALAQLESLTADRDRLLAVVSDLEGKGKGKKGGEDTPPVTSAPVPVSPPAPSAPIGAPVKSDVEVESLMEENKTLRASLRRLRLGGLLTEGEWATQKEVIAGMDDAAFDLLASKIIPPVKTADRRLTELKIGEASPNGHKRVSLR